MKDVIEELRTLYGSNSMLQSWYIQAESLVSKVDVVPCGPQTPAYQQHHDNIEHSSAVEQYHRELLYFPYWII